MGATTKCQHTAWVQMISGKAEHRIIQTNILHRLANSLSGRHEHHPRITLLLGKGTKDEALRHFCKFNNLKRNRRSTYDAGILRIRCETSSSTCKYPCYYADVDPSRFALGVESGRSNCHPENNISVKWSPDKRRFEDLIVSRLIFPFLDVICLFAEDCGGRSAVYQLLAIWADLFVASEQSNIALEVIIVTTSPVEEFEEDCSRLRHLFPGVYRDLRAFKLPGSTLSPASRYLRLNTLIMQLLDSCTTRRMSHSMLFNAKHQASLFDLALEHFANSPGPPFNFVRASRSMTLETDFGDYVARSIAFLHKAKIPISDILRLHASCIMMNAYPRGTHYFQPAVVFKDIYEQHYQQALEEHRDGQEVTKPRELVKEILTRMDNLYDRLVDGGTTSTLLHLEVLRLTGTSALLSNVVCLCCHFQRPEYPLDCGHALCQRCVRSFGHNVLTSQWPADAWLVRYCPVCRRSCSGTVPAKPPTAGVRILSIDGGGVKGIVPLQILQQLQELAGPNCPVQSLFDLVYGTSIGGIIVLNLFYRHATIDQSIQMFHYFTQTLFGQRPLLENKWAASAIKVLKCWTQDGLYNTNDLQKALMTQFGRTNTMFDTARCGVKLGVTACSTKDCLARVFTNYNGSGSRVGDAGYKMERPADICREPYVWQVARATSAAPGLFKPIYIPAIGTYDDGALKYNNPVEIAIWECRHIWPDVSKPDVVVSIGTGHCLITFSPASASPKSAIKDKFVFRLWRSFMTSIDGQSTWRDLMNRLDDDNRRRYHRLTITLPGPEPAPDDYESIDQLAKAVQDCDDGLSNQRNALVALLTSSFYLELESLPEFQNGYYNCQARLRCRSSQIVESLMQLSFGEYEFSNGPVHFAILDIADICQTCGRYVRRVNFVVRSLEELMNVQLGQKSQTTSPIGAMPRPLSWFIDQQRLNVPFGCIDSYSTAACAVCMPTEDSRNAKKRVQEELSEEATPIRRRLR